MISKTHYREIDDILQHRVGPNASHWRPLVGAHSWKETSVYFKAFKEMCAKTGKTIYAIKHPNKNYNIHYIIKD